LGFQETGTPDDPDVAALQTQVDVPRPMAEQAVKELRRRGDGRNAIVEQGSIDC
jgi:hypothetical protein